VYYGHELRKLGLYRSNIKQTYMRARGGVEEEGLSLCRYLMGWRCPFSL